VRAPNGMQKNTFAVIEAEGIQELLVVAIERILGATELGTQTGLHDDKDNVKMIHITRPERI
jgi:hypothetical protein